MLLLVEALVWFMQEVFMFNKKFIIPILSFKNFDFGWSFQPNPKIGSYSKQAISIFGERLSFVLE